MHPRRRTLRYAHTCLRHLSARMGIPMPPLRIGGLPPTTLAQTNGITVTLNAWVLYSVARTYPTHNWILRAILAHELGHIAGRHQQHQPRFMHTTAFLTALALFLTGWNPLSIAWYYAPAWFFLAAAGGLAVSLLALPLYIATIERDADRRASHVAPRAMRLFLSAIGTHPFLCPIRLRSKDSPRMAFQLLRSYLRRYFTLPTLPTPSPADILASLRPEAEDPSTAPPPGTDVILAYIATLDETPPTAP